jgi:hypothetical protein
MGDRDMNFKVPMIRSKDMSEAKFNKTGFISSTLYLNAFPTLPLLYIQTKS